MSGAKRLRAKLAEATTDPAIEAALVRKSVKETVRLGEARGETFRKPIEKDKPFERLDGLAWLLAGAHITKAQHEAGARYGSHYALVYEVHRNPSSLEAGFSSGNVVPELVKRYGDSLSGARREGLGRNRDLIDVCNIVCGGGARIAPRTVLSGRLRVALDRLSAYYAGSWSPEGDDFSNLTKTEWFSIAQTVTPELDWDGFDAIWNDSGMGERAEQRAHRRAVQAGFIELYGRENCWGVGGSGAKPVSRA